MLPAITVARFAAVLLGVVSTALSAQSTSTGQLVITVIDQSGAVIPGASIGIIQLPVANPQSPYNLDWIDYARHASVQTSTRANTSGVGTFSLAKGNYAISIAEEGFERFFERIEIRDESNQSLRATLVIVNGGCGVCVKETAPIPLEPAVLNTLIPLESLQRITLFPTPVRRRCPSDGCESPPPAVSR
jgi:PEGA domain